MRGAIAGVALVALASVGCMPAIVVRDPVSACRVARSVLRQPLSAADLVEVTATFPRANAQARRAYHGRLAGIVLTGIGAAALLAGLVTGFAADRTEREVAIATYTLVGGALGLGAGALLAGALAGRARTRAYAELDAATRAECP
jgi:hypothetical protein